MNDAMEAIGWVHVTKTDKETGEVVYDKWFKNQLTNYARQSAASMWAGTVVQAPSQITVGTGAPPTGQSGAMPTDTSMWAEIQGARKNVDYAEVWLQYYTQYSITYQTNEAIGAVTSANPTGSINILEAGLYDISGNLWSHVVLNGVEHDNSTTLSIQWQVLQNAN